MDSKKEPTKLAMWIASLVAHRVIEGGYKIEHGAELIKADSETVATELALERARKKFPEEGYEYSVSLGQIEWEAPPPITVTVEVRP